jgi:hypothetical protein
MVFVPAGEFSMGDAALGGPHVPVHRVRLTRPYYLDAAPLTTTQFGEFATQRRYQTAPERTLPERRRDKQGRWIVKHPKTWKDLNADGFADGGGGAVVFVDWVDAQAYAAWAGAELPTEAQVERASGMTGLATGLVGVLQFWCSDWYEDRYYAQSPPDDPKGPAQGAHHSVRSIGSGARTSRGGRTSPDDGVGIRLAKTIP